MLNLIHTAQSDQLLDHVGQVIRGSFWVMLRRDRTTATGLSQIQLTLEDGADSITGYIWPEHQPLMPTIPINVPVTVIADVREFDFRPILRIRQLRLAEMDDVTVAASLLPRSRCPANSWPGLNQLIELECQLPEPLRGFLKRVLLDPQIALPFLSCRASVKHHHNNLGGLLTHCTELIDVAGELAHLTMPQDPTAPAIAQLGYLLHDLGKLRSVGDYGRPQDPFVLRHESHTIVLLAPHLAWLEYQDRELALALRYVFEHLATPPKARQSCTNYLVAEIVESLDRFSAASHAGRNLSTLLGRRPISWGPATQGRLKILGEPLALKSAAIHT